MKKLIVVFFTFIVVNTISAQSWGLDPFLSFMHNQNELNLEFSYDSMTITTSISETNLDLTIIPEPEFVKQQTEKFNTKLAGSGDKWANDWYNARAAYFELAFEKGFKGKLLKEIGINATIKNTQAKYTMIVQTTNIIYGKMRVSDFTARGGATTGQTGAYCDYFVKIVETADHSKLMARAVIQHMFGQGVYSIQQYKPMPIAACYENAGIKFAKGFIKAYLK